MLTRREKDRKNTSEQHKRKTHSEENVKRSKTPRRSNNHSETRKSTSYRGSYEYPLITKIKKRVVKNKTKISAQQKDQLETKKDSSNSEINFQTALNTQNDLQKQQQDKKIVSDESLKIIAAETSLADSTRQRTNSIKNSIATDTNIASASNIRINTRFPRKDDKKFSDVNTDSGPKTRVGGASKSQTDKNIAPETVSSPPQNLIPARKPNLARKDDEIPQTSINNTNMRSGTSSSEVCNQVENNDLNPNPTTLEQLLEDPKQNKEIQISKAIDYATKIIIELVDHLPFKETVTRIWCSSGPSKTETDVVGGNIQNQPEPVEYQGNENTSDNKPNIHRGAIPKVPNKKKKRSKKSRKNKDKRKNDQTAIGFELDMPYDNIDPGPSISDNNKRGKKRIRNKSTSSNQNPPLSGTANYIKKKPNIQENQLKSSHSMITRSRNQEAEDNHEIAFIYGSDPYTPSRNPIMLKKMELRAKYGKNIYGEPEEEAPSDKPIPNNDTPNDEEEPYEEDTIVRSHRRRIKMSIIRLYLKNLAVGTNLSIEDLITGQFTEEYMLKCLKELPLTDENRTVKKLSCMTIWEAMQWLHTLEKEEKRAAYITHFEPPCPCGGRLLPMAVLFPYSFDEEDDKIQEEHAYIYEHLINRYYRDDIDESRFNRRNLGG